MLVLSRWFMRLPPRHYRNVGDIVHNRIMRLLNDELPNDDDFNADDREQFNAMDQSVFRSDAQGWLDVETLKQVRSHLPITYVEIIPVRVNQEGTITSVGILTRATDEGTIEKALVAGRVLYHETIREAIMRHIAKDLGELALPQLPTTIVPFTVAEFFPTPGMTPFYDARQHAIALCYVVPIVGDCKPCDNAIGVEWLSPRIALRADTLEAMQDGHGVILQRGLSWAMV